MNCYQKIDESRNFVAQFRGNLIRSLFRHEQFANRLCLLISLWNFGEKNWRDTLRRKSWGAKPQPRTKQNAQASWLVIIYQTNDQSTFRPSNVVVVFLRPQLIEHKSVISHTWDSVGRNEYVNLTTLHKSLFWCPLVFLVLATRYWNRTAWMARNDKWAKCELCVDVRFKSILGEQESCWLCDSREITWVLLMGQKKPIWTLAIAEPGCFHTQRGSTCKYWYANDQSYSERIPARTSEQP